eukprot:Nitzschia sp. Nitz4//scaffold136_size62208//23797//26334//NITZ4_006366-RA/size62208-processed-gene-0.35-mRNA-1//-1//CDS//3329535612//1233//frame0
MKTTVACLLLVLFQGVSGNDDVVFGIGNKIMPITSRRIRGDRKHLNEMPRRLSASSSKKSKKSQDKSACPSDAREVCDEEGGTTIYLCHVYEDELGLVQEEDICIKETKVEKYLEKHEYVACGRCTPSWIEDLRGLLVDEDILSILSESSGGLELHAVLPSLILGTISVSGNQVQFEVEPDRNTIEITGTFIADSGTIPDNALIQAFGPTGLSSTSTIDQSTGDFSIALTDLPIGNFPYVLVALLDPETSDTGTDRKLASASSGSSTTVWVSDWECPVPVSATLTWTGGRTSDIDLHVTEPDGTQVWYGHMEGTYGFLDHDDVEGYGPENYFAAEADEGSVFNVKVRAYDMDEDRFARWSLVGKVFGEEVWTESGTFTSTGQSSAMFPLNASSDEEFEGEGWKVGNWLIEYGRKGQAIYEAPKSFSQRVCKLVSRYTRIAGDKIFVEYPAGLIVDIMSPANEELSTTCKYTQDKKYGGKLLVSVCGFGLGAQGSSETALGIQGCVCGPKCALQDIQGSSIENIVLTQSGCYERENKMTATGMGVFEKDVSKSRILQWVQSKVSKKLKVSGKLVLELSHSALHDSLTKGGHACEGGGCPPEDKTTLAHDFQTKATAQGGAIFFGYPGLKFTLSAVNIGSIAGSYEGVSGDVCLSFNVKGSVELKVAGGLDIEVEAWGKKKFWGNIITATCSLDLAMTTCDGIDIDFEDCEFKLFEEEENVDGYRQLKKKKNKKKDEKDDDVLSNADIAGMGLTLDNILWNEVELECSDVGYECGSFYVESGEKDCGTCEEGLECRDTEEGGTICGEPDTDENDFGDLFAATSTKAPTSTSTKAPTATKAPTKSAKV